MPTLCKAGNKSTKCDHKRNAGEGVVTCAINANKVQCCFAETTEEYKSRVNKVDIFIDTVKIATLYNTNTGVPNMDDVMPIDSLYIPPNSLLHAYVIDAPATNPLYLGIQLEEIEEI